MEAVQEREAGKESIKAFCERKGVSRNTYFYWQRKIRGALAGELEAVTETARSEKAETSLAAPAGWAQIKGESLVPQEDEKSGVTIEIGKFQIQTTERTNTGLLSKVCKMLVDIC